MWLQTSLVHIAPILHFLQNCNHPRRSSHHTQVLCKYSSVHVKTHGALLKTKDLGHTVHVLTHNSIWSIYLTARSFFSFLVHCILQQNLKSSRHKRAPSQQPRHGSLGMLTKQQKRSWKRTGPRRKIWYWLSTWSLMPMNKLQE